MSDRFPLRPDGIWYSAMREIYGAVVPEIDSLQFRRGLQAIVGDMFAQLRDRDILRHVEIHRVVTRNACFTVIDARGHFGLPYSECGAVDGLLAIARGRLNESCEHCGKPGEIVAKIGMEALLDDPDAVLGDRFLCAECYESWRRTHD